MKKTLSALYFILFLTNAFALQIDVEQAVNTALKNNTSIARQQISLDAAERAKNHSWNSISPSLSAGATATLPMDSLTGGDQTSKYSSKLSISATATVNLSANLYTSMKNAKLSYEQSLISFNDALKSVELNVRQTYYGLLYEKENLRLQEENLKIAETQYKNNLARYNSGRLSEVDSISAEVNYKSKIPVVENARTTYLNDLSTFKQILGLDIDEEVELTGSLEEVLYLKDITVDSQNINSSTVKNLETKLENARFTVMDKRFSAFAPSLSASLRWNDGDWYSGYDGTAPDATKSSSVTLSASIPLDGLLPWSARNDAVDNALGTVADLELQLESAKKDLRRNIDSGLRSIKHSQESIRYKQANIVLAEKSYDMTLEAYNRGTKDLLALQNSNTTLLNAKVSLNSEILTLKKAILSLENTIGVQFGTLTK